MNFSDQCSGKYTMVFGVHGFNRAKTSFLLRVRISIKDIFLKITPDLYFIQSNTNTSDTNGIGAY